MSSNESIDYRAVLADLESKRAAIDRMIETVKQFIGMSPTVQTDGTKEPLAPPKGNGADSTEPLTDDSFLAMSIPDAIRKYLRVVKRKQSVTDIVAALERGGIQHTSKSFWKTVNATLHRVWESQGDVVQVGADWAMAEWYPGRKFEKTKTAKPGRKRKAAKPSGTKPKTKQAKETAAGPANASS